jgi:hypothetical protein
MAYIVWPLALFDALRPQPDATAWSRIHSRQALFFGALGSLAYLALLAIPLFVVIAAPGIALGVVVWVYAVGLFADVIAAFALLGLAMRFRERALRGELFAIPLITALVDRFFRLEH